jgi:hypothetical protein
MTLQILWDEYDKNTSKSKNTSHGLERWFYDSDLAFDLAIKILKELHIGGDNIN